MEYNRGVFMMKTLKLLTCVYILESKTVERKSSVRTFVKIKGLKNILLYNFLKKKSSLGKIFF